MLIRIRENWSAAGEKKLSFFGRYQGETVKKWSKIGYFWGPQILRIFVNVNTDSQTIGWILKKKTLRGVNNNTPVAHWFSYVRPAFWKKNLHKKWITFMNVTSSLLGRFRSDFTGISIVNVCFVFCTLLNATITISIAFPSVVLNRKCAGTEQCSSLIS